MRALLSYDGADDALHRRKQERAPDREALGTAGRLPFPANASSFWLLAGLTAECKTTSQRCPFSSIYGDRTCQSNFLRDTSLISLGLLFPKPGSWEADLSCSRDRAVLHGEIGCSVCRPHRLNEPALGTPTSSHPQLTALADSGCTMCDTNSPSHVQANTQHKAYAF